MSICPISSDRSEGPASRRRILAILLPLVLLIASDGVLPRVAAAQQVLSQEEALRLAFPGATRIERKTAYLDDRQLAAARQAAGRGVDVVQNVLTYYVGTSGGRPLGVAYFDAHRVRTLPEVLMVVVNPAHRVERIEVLQFSEPPEYRAPEGWLELFDGEALGDDLALRRGIPNMTGASLTSDAVTDAVRRILALHRVIAPFGARAEPASR